MYPWAYRVARNVWPGGIETRRHLRELQNTQWLLREDLEKWQLNRIKSLLQHAEKHVPYYRNLFERMGIHAADIRTFSDFRNLPFLTKEIIRENLDTLVSPSMRNKADLHYTGGSTGEPTALYIEKDYWWWDAALEFRGRGWYGIHEGDKIAWIWGADRDMDNWSRTGRIKARLQQHRFLNAFSMTEQKMLNFATALVRWQPAMIRAYGSSLYLFARFLEDRKITGIRPKLIETTAEKLTENQRSVIERVFACRIADWYSAREFGTIAFQCEAGGMHVCETRYLEIVTNNRPVPAGVLGEVVITSLNQLAMPLIRYKMKDMAIWSSGRCRCGRNLPLIQEIVGRTDDYLVTSTNEFVHGGFFEIMLMSNSSIKQYQICQPDRQHLELRLVCNRPLDASYVENIRANIQYRFGSGVHIDLSFPERFELNSAGKHRCIISAVKPDFI